MLIQNIKDKRVDKQLKKNGFDHFTLFYSPISFWVVILVGIILSGAGLFYSILASEYIILIIPYLFISYLVNAYLNNSFALTGDKLIVINPNFPFRKFKSYNRQEIKKITIDKIRMPWFLYFAAFGKNYVQIETKENASVKYYCINLEEDAYDENWTDETLDTFNSTLKDKGYPAVFNI